MIITEIQGTPLQIDFYHEAPFDDISNEEFNGMTVCRLVVSGQEFLGYGFCHPKDNFNRAVGRKYALKSAIGVLETKAPLTKDQKRAIWDAAWSVMKKPFTKTLKPRTN